MTGVASSLAGIPPYIWILAGATAIMIYLLIKGAQQRPPPLYHYRVLAFSEGMLVGDTYVTVWRDPDTGAYLWADIRRGGERYIGLAFESKATHMMSRKIEELNAELGVKKGALPVEDKKKFRQIKTELERKGLADVLGFYYLATEEGVVSSDAGSIGMPRPNTLYLLVRVPSRWGPLEIQRRISKILHELAERGGTGFRFTPIPAHIFAFYMMDAWGNPLTQAYKPVALIPTEIKTPEAEEGLLAPPMPAVQVQGPIVETEEEITAEELSGIFGSVDNESKLVQPSRIGYSYLDNKPVSIDFRNPSVAHIAVVGGSGAGKSYLAGVIVERAAHDNNAAVIVIDPFNRHNSYGIQNTPEVMSAREKELVQQYLKVTGAKEEPISIPVRLLLVGKKGANIPYDDIFTINVPQMDDVSLVYILTEVGAEVSSVQELVLRAILRYMRETVKVFDLQDLANVITDIREHPDRYAQVLKKYGLSDIQRYESTLIALTLRIRGVIEKLPDTFVAKGGTDFRNPLYVRKGMVTSIVFAPEVSNDTNLLKGIVSYILQQVDATLGSGAPDQLERSKMVEQMGGGIHYLLVLEEAHRYITPDSPVTPVVERICEVGRKYGVHLMFIFQTVKPLPPSVIPNIRLAKFVFPPESKDEQTAMLNILTGSTKEQALIRDAFNYILTHKMSTGFCVTAGLGVNVRGFAVVRVCPRRTRHEPVTTYEAWEAFRATHPLEEAQPTKPARKRTTSRPRRTRTKKQPQQTVSLELPDSEPAQ